MSLPSFLKESFPFQKGKDIPVWVTVAVKLLLSLVILKFWSYSDFDWVSILNTSLFRQLTSGARFRIGSDLTTITIKLECSASILSVLGIKKTGTYRWETFKSCTLVADTYSFCVYFYFLSKIFGEKGLELRKCQELHTSKSACGVPLCLAVSLFSVVHCHALSYAYPLQWELLAWKSSRRKRQEMRWGSSSGEDWQKKKSACVLQEYTQNTESV